MPSWEWIWREVRWSVRAYFAPLTPSYWRKVRRARGWKQRLDALVGEGRG